MRSSVLLMFLIFMTVGCAHTAVVECWEPAEIDVAGMSRIVVIDFSGEQGSAIASSLSARLWENEFYTVLDRSELATGIQTASFSENPSLQEILDSARSSEIDGVVLGSVVEYRCDDQILKSASLNFFQEQESNNDFERAGLDVEVESNEVLLREGSVTIAFRFVDVETGEVRASKQVSKHFTNRSTNGHQDIPSQGAVLEMLTRECLDEVVQMLAPHESSCEMQLATCNFWTKGSREFKKGLKSARNGDWSGAEKFWQNAIAENPENHAALYNLAIVAAKRQDYDLAEQFALDALKVEHKECYTTGLGKIRERRTAWSRANDQRDARVVSAGETFWQ